MRLNVIMAILAIALVFLQYRLWFETGGVRDMLQIKKMLKVQASENETLKQHNDELLAQIKRLQKSQEATETHARNELGMIKKDEMFYQIVKSKGDA